VHVLIVEDDPRLGRLLQRLLAEERHVVDLAVGGGEALELVEAGGRFDALILDVAGVTYVDSAGLGQLAQIHANTNSKQTALRLVGVGKRLRDLLFATRLLSLFQVFDTEDAALASFNGAPSA